MLISAAWTDHEGIFENLIPSPMLPAMQLAPETCLHCKINCWIKPSDTNQTRSKVSSGPNSPKNQITVRIWYFFLKITYSVGRSHSCFSSTWKWQRLQRQCWGHTRTAHTTASRGTPQIAPQSFQQRLTPGTNLQDIKVIAKPALKPIYLYLIILILVANFITVKAFTSVLYNFIDIKSPLSCWETKNSYLSSLHHPKWHSHLGAD